MIKRGSSKASIFFLLTMLIALAGVIAAASINDTFLPAKEQALKLATKVNNISTDTPYARAYLELYKNFSNTKYERVPFNSTAKARLMVGAKEDNIQGVEIGYNRYAIHLILCNHNTKTCAFRINGIATGALAAVNYKNVEAPSKFDLDENSTLEITGIQLDYCDGRRFCNVYYEAYDIVNVTVITR